MTAIVEKLNTSSDFDGKEVVDAQGRKIVLRKADIMDKFYLFRAMGNDASNPMLVAMMMTTVFVAAIDGSPFPTPRTLMECEASLKRLGEDGMEIVNKTVNEYLELRDKEAKNTIKK